MVASGQNNSRVGEAWTRYLQSPKAVDARSDSKLKAFSTVADGIFRSWDKVGVRESMTQMLKEAESGHISDDELFLLVKAADMRQKALTTTDGGKNWLQKTGDNLNKINPFHNDSNHSEVQKGYDAVVAHAEDSDEDKGTGVKTYLKEVAKGTDPKSAKDIAIKDVDGISRFFPDYKSYPVKGKPKLIGNKVYRIFPDATWKEDK
jgi:hypothetical protein